MIPAPTTLVFDWDGTLVDSVTRIVGTLSGALAAIGRPPLPEARLRAVIGIGLHDIARVLVPERDERAWQRFVDAYRGRWLAPDAPRARLFDGVADTLGQLRDRGYRIAVATGKSRRGLDRELDETGLRALVEASRCADETRSKPHPQMLHEVLAELAVPSKAAVMIGDTAHDLQMAQAAGVPSIAVGCGVQTLDELRAFLPVAAVPRVTALADVLLGAGRSISATVIDPS